MGFNLKKAKIDREHTDSLLEEKRNKNNHVPPEEGTIEMNLKKNDKSKEDASVLEKRLKKHHAEDKKQAKTIEARMDDEKKRDNRTHKTNTLPINELAEEAQRARLKARGEKDVLDKSHFQNHKKEDLGLSKENFAKLDGINRTIDKLWMASSWNRLTTAEQNTIKKLIKERDNIVRQ